MLFLVIPACNRLSLTPEVLSLRPLRFPLVTHPRVVPSPLSLEDLENSAQHSQTLELPVSHLLRQTLRTRRRRVVVPRSPSASLLPYASSRPSTGPCGPSLRRCQTTTLTGGCVSFWLSLYYEPWRTNREYSGNYIGFCATGSSSRSFA